MGIIKEITLTKTLAGLFIICLMSLPARAQYGSGTGEPNDPYLIYTAEQMNEIGANRKEWDKHFKLMADIDLSLYAGRDFNIIGRNMNNAFKGVFDGNGKNISNFIYSSTSGSYTGIFGYVRDTDAEIMNLGLIDPNIEGGSGSGVGALAGWIYEGRITNCYVKGGSVSSKKWIGGLVGNNRRGIINDCYSTCSVSGNELAGGLVGYNNGKIDNCSAAGIVSGDKQIGGLTGHNSGTITNSQATGEISGDERDVGGLAGRNSGNITHCYSTGMVSAYERYVGGLVGNNSGTIDNCSAQGDIHGVESVGGLTGRNSGAISGSCSSGSVSGEGDIGGLVGSNTDIIMNCYSLVGVTGIEHVGGLVGINTWPGKINNCYSAGCVTGTTDVGGLLGFNDEAVIRTSFWDIQISSQNDMCGRQVHGIGCNDANGKTTAEMQTESTFLNAGWDFVAETANGADNIWSICDGLNYPELARQFLIGDFDGDSRVTFVDFAVFASRWLQSDSGFFWCRGADLTNDGKVDLSDLEEFAENWLAEGIRSSMEADSILIVDDFENYNDLDPGTPESNRIFDIWLDGYDNSATNGSLVGHANPPYAEQSIVHGGRQSMPYSYSTFFKFSKVELPLNPPQDWIEEGAEILSLWFRGDSSNAAAPMAFVVNGSSAVYHDNPNAARIDAWTEWTIELQAFANVDLSNVNSIAICFGYENNIQAGGSGVMYFDDILLYRPAPREP
ncbi:MAG: hypothetical protein GY774_03255 [Planctomycetes bacterium]|nr:hypothetical protein [Planctomycetota bacterium]